MCYQTGGCQITAQPKAGGAPVPIVLEEAITADTVVEMVEEGLRSVGMRVRDVASWCLHPGDEHPYPGNFMRCTTGNVRDWLREQVGRTFPQFT